MRVYAGRMASRRWWCWRQKMWGRISWVVWSTAHQAAAAGCFRCTRPNEAVVVTSVHAGRTWSTAVTSVVRSQTVALRVYYEGGEPTLPEVCPGFERCFGARDLRRLYPWLEAFAVDSPGSTFRAARTNAKNATYPPHAEFLTSKAHFVYYKLAALRHAFFLERTSYKAVIWADADATLRKPLDARFLRFVESNDVSTIHRYVLRLDKCAGTMPWSTPALPETGVVALNARSLIAADFVTAWADYALSDAARRAACLNDICVYDRLLLTRDNADRLLPDEVPRVVLSGSRAPIATEAAIATSAGMLENHGGNVSESRPAPTDARLAAFVRSSGRVRQGVFATCPEAWLADPDVSEYRVDFHRAHPCPGASSNVSDFHLFEYFAHAKAGSKRKQRLEIETPRKRSAISPAARHRWRRFRTDVLSTPFDRRRGCNLGPFARAALHARVPLQAAIYAAKHVLGISFYRHVVGNATCALDPDFLTAHIRFEVQACDCRVLLQQATLAPGPDAFLQAAASLLESVLVSTRQSGDTAWVEPAVDGCPPTTSLAKCAGLVPATHCGLLGRLNHNERKPPLWVASLVASRLFRPTDAALDRVWPRLDRLTRRRTSGKGLLGVLIDATAQQLPRALPDFDAIILVCRDCRCEDLRHSYVKRPCVVVAAAGPLNATASDHLRRAWDAYFLLAHADRLLFDALSGPARLVLALSNAYRGAACGPAPFDVFSPNPNVDLSSPNLLRTWFRSGSDPPQPDELEPAELAP